MKKNHSNFMVGLHKPSFLSILSLFAYGISICLFIIPLFRNSLFQPNSLTISKIITDPIINESKQIRLVIIKANDYEVKFPRLAFSGDWHSIVYENSQYMESHGNKPVSVSTLLPFNTSKIEIWFASGPNEGKVNINLNGFDQQLVLTESENGEGLALFPNTLFTIKQLFYYLIILLIAFSVLFLLFLLLKKLYAHSIDNMFRFFLTGFLPGFIGACLAISFSMSTNTFSIFNRGIIYQKIVLFLLIIIASCFVIFISKIIIYPSLKRLSSRNQILFICASLLFAIVNYLKYYSNNLRIEFFFIHFVAFFFMFILFMTLLSSFYEKCIKVLPVFVFICLFVVVISYLLFLLQGKQGNLFTHDHLGIDTGYYDYLGRNILHGKLDVPSNVIAEEAFVYNDKTYGYFGIAPALLHLPLNWLFPDLFGKWTSAMLLIACLSNQIFTFLIINKFIKIWKLPQDSPQIEIMIGLFLLISGLGTTNIFLTQPSVYVEASMLGSSFSLGFFYFFLHYLYKPTSNYLLLISALCFLAFHTRQTSGLGVFVAMGLLVFFFILNRIGFYKFNNLTEKTNPPFERINISISKIPVVHIMIIVAVILFSGLLQVGMNFYRFGTLFDSTPFDHYIAFKQSPELMPKQPYYTWPYVRFALDTLLFPERITLIKEPLLHIETYPQKDYGFMTPSIRNPASFAVALPVLMFPLFVLSFVGIFSIGKYKRELLLVVASPMMSALALFFSGGVAQRHSHDVFPFFIIAGAAGLTWLMNKCNLSQKFQKMLLSLLGIFGLISIYLNIANILI